MNRHERRAAAARMRNLASSHARAIAGHNGDHSADPDVRVGIARTVRSIDFKLPEQFTGAGKCTFRSLVAAEVMRHCQIDARIEIGSLLYRVGPDPYRDVVAFCGQGNAGYDIGANAAIFHTWIVAGNNIADFSVGDWPGLSQEVRLPGMPALGPIHWTIPTPPPYWWRPRAELTEPWRSTGTPALGEVWYGPFNGDPFRAQQALKDLQ